ncbi:YobI family P-loop NTPase [Actinomyces sp. zg296]|uniref:YobI family P-loop NTPase n=1 Tax=Actinomyces sp. zg296 TaxID=2609289 RepID=UPI00135AF525|nr:hypothetical protein [Actinomyces sp. zg296]
MSSSQHTVENSQCQAKTEIKSTRLRSLCPQYDETRHKAYVDRIVQALDDPNIHNIALSGAYGTGKSSILQGLKKYKPSAIFISLSTLGTNLVDNSSNGQLSNHASPAEQANRIQKEIVKQLLYRADPQKLPASRFKRIHGVRCISLIARSVSVAAAMALVSLIVGLPDKLPLVSEQPWYDLVIKLSLVSLLLTILLLALGRHLQGTISLDKVAVGPTTVSLSANAETYFDRYLDEIIYFFEITKLRLVVFEDIDRFENPQIFDQLRELNTLLNNAGQLKRKGQTCPVVFVYAVKDSIFDTWQYSNTTSATDGARRDLATVEVERANRTKFFDLIIPVVSFVTHQSARDLLKQELRDVHPSVSPELINLAAKHVPDLRLLRSACNEYQIYADLLLRGNGLELEHDKLFAMMLYKVVHMRDFEQIRLGASALDEVYKKSVSVIQRKIAQLNEKYDDFEKEVNAENEAKARGEKFTELIKRIVATQNNREKSFYVEVDGNKYAKSQTVTTEFWDKIAHLADDDELIISPDNYESTFTTIYLTKLHLAEFIGRNLVYHPPRTASAERLKWELKNISSEREKFRRATMSNLIEWDTVVPDMASNGEKCSFSKYIRHCLGSRLATDLIRYGYIDRNFVLYTSIYQDISLSASAMSFKIQHIDAGRMNAIYRLDDHDLKDLLPSLDHDELMQPGAYNIFILDYLLRKPNEMREYSAAMVDALVRDGHDERQLLQEYFSSEEVTRREQEDKLVALLAPKLPSLFTRIIELEGVPDHRQRHLMDVALRSMADSIDYDTAGLEDFIKASYDELESLKFGSGVQLNAGMVALLFQKAEVKIARLGALREDLCEKLIDNQSYEINRDNLETIVRSDDISLDRLKKDRQTCYEYVTAHLDKYLAALTEDSTVPASALTGNELVGEVVADLANNKSHASSASVDEPVGSTAAEQTFSVLDRVLDKTDKSVMIILGEPVPVKCWPTLAQQGRFAVDTNNTLAYIEACGFDEALAQLMVEQGGIESSGKLEYSDYLAIAKPILEADERLIGLDQRIDLVKSLGNAEYIDPDDIEPIAGDMIGRLICSGIIEDDERSYQLARQLDNWPSRESAIASSKKFIDFMSPDIVKDDAAQIVNSKRIGEAVKRKILENPHLYCSRLSSEDLMTIRERAVSCSELRLGEDALMFFAEHYRGATDVIILLVCAIDNLEGTSIRNIVRALGDVYADLLVPGRKEVRVPAVRSLEKILDKLKTVGAVSTYKSMEGGREFKVHRRQK